MTSHSDQPLADTTPDTESDAATAWPLAQMNIELVIFHTG